MRICGCCRSGRSKVLLLLSESFLLLLPERILVLFLASGRRSIEGLDYSLGRFAHMEYW